MNPLLNLKIAGTKLQFGIDKCKSMLICKKKPEHVLNSHLLVDNWKVKHKDNEITGESDLIETFEGLVTIDKTANQK